MSEQVFQVLLGGLATGSVYGLIALGLVLILTTTSVANFAHGEMGLLATFIAYSVTVDSGLQGVLAVLLGLLVGVVVGAALGVAVERLAVRPMAGQPLITVAVLTLGLYFLFHALTGSLYGPQSRVFPPLFGGGVVRVGNIGLSVQQLGILGVSLTAALSLGAWLRYARAGIASRALVQNPFGAALSGVPLSQLKTTMWAVGTALAALAGILIAPTTGLSENMMLPLIVQAFAAAALGGLGSLSGAFLGGLLLGVVTSAATVFVNGNFATSIGLVAVLVVLLFRPAGLMGRGQVEKV